MAIFAIAGKAEATRGAGCRSLDKKKNGTSHKKTPLSELAFMPVQREVSFVRFSGFISFTDI